MKLSFSTRGWENLPWAEQLDTASIMRFGGVEVYNAHKQDAYFDKGGPFHKYAVNATVRELKEKKLEIPCLDSSCDLSAPGSAAVEALSGLIALASDLRVPCVCGFAAGDDEQAVRENISALLPLCTQKHVVLLIKTSGHYSDTARLRDLMNAFACDELAVLWDMHHTYRDHGERAAKTIENLGAYVRHVHLRDSDDDGSYNLIGEGSLPVREMMDALSSINYDGFISLEWKPEWMADLSDREVIFPHFVNYMSRFESPRTLKKPLYSNKRHTGQFVWKKDALIEQTFPKVLDRMAEEFPDQLAIKYTTLNYTRTYAEFRDDVDEFARGLIALGV